MVLRKYRTHVTVSPNEIGVQLWSEWSSFINLYIECGNTYLNVYISLRDNPPSDTSNYLINWR